MTTTTNATIAATADAAFNHIVTAEVAQRAGMSYHTMTIAIANERAWAAVCDEVYAAIITNDGAALRQMGLYTLTIYAAGPEAGDLHARRAAAADHYTRCARIARRNIATFEASRDALLRDAGR